MLRFLLPAFALACALLVLFAGAFSDHLRSYEMADRTTHLPGTPPDTTQVQPPPVVPQTGSTPSQQELQAAQPPAAPQALQRQVQTLQQQTSALQEQLARRSQELDQRTNELERRTRDLQAAQAEADKFRLGAESLRQLRDADTGKQQQVVAHSDEPVGRAPAVDQRQQQPDARPENMEAVQANADRLRHVIDALRQRNKAEDATPARPKQQDANPVRQKAEEQSPTRQQAKPQQVIANAQPQPPTPAKPVEPAAGSADTPSPARQLMTARQWLAAGRPDEARRLLAVVQTQLVLQPVTPDAPEARGTSIPAGDVGNAIRWLDLGANRQAMQAINKAIEDSSGPVNTVRAWSGYPIGIYSGYSRPYAAEEQR